MNFDTSVRLWVVQSPWQHLLHNIKYVELSPPAWHVGMKFLVQISPINPVITIRGVNYLLYLALIPGGYLLGYRIYDEFTGLLAAGLLPLNQLVFDFTTRVDHYMLFGLLTLVFSWSLLVWIQAPLKRRRVILHAVVTTFYGAVHYYAALYILGATSVSLYLYWNSGFQRVLDGIGPKRRNISALLSGLSSRRTITLVGIHLPLGIFYIYWLPVFFSQYRAYRTTFGGQPNLAFHKFVIRSVGLLRHFFAEAPYPRLVFAVIAFLILVLAMAGMYAKDNREMWTVVAGSSFTLGLVVASDGFYASRHVFFLAGIVPVVLATGVRYGTSFILGQTHTTIRSVIVVFGVGLLILLLTPYITTAATFDPPERDTNLRIVTDFVEANVDEHTIILSSHPWGELILDTYNVAPSVPVYGVPTDAVTGNHRVQAVRGRTRYSPSTHPSDYRKVRSSIEEAETVIIFDARGHPYGLYDALLSDLRDLDYYCEEMIRSGDNGALVFRRGSSEDPGTCTNKTST